MTQKEISQRIEAFKKDSDFIVNPTFGGRWTIVGNNSAFVYKAFEESKEQQARAFAAKLLHNKKHESFLNNLDLLIKTVEKYRENFISYWSSYEYVIKNETNFFLNLRNKLFIWFNFKRKTKKLDSSIATLKNVIESFLNPLI